MPTNDDNASSFAARFAEAWNAPTPDRLVALLTDDVVLVQPLGPTTNGAEAARQGLARLLSWIPDLRADVHDHWGDERRVVIEFDLVGTVGGRPLRWRVVDIFELRDGLGSRRRAHFDPTPLIGALLTRPRAWIPYLRSGLWRR